jgi:hypothetical protein
MSILYTYSTIFTLQNEQIHTHPCIASHFFSFSSADTHTGSNTDNWGVASTTSSFRLVLFHCILYIVLYNYARITIYSIYDQRAICR